jgi:hypothetical protein
MMLDSPIMRNHPSRPPADPARPDSQPNPEGTTPLAARPAGRTGLRPATETIRLAPGACLIPPSLLVPPFTNDRRGILRDEAAVLLNRHLRRLARMGTPIELRISRLLGRMKRLSAYLDLGFARMTDYAVERLGLSPRSTRTLLQIDDGLRRLPATARAYEAGRLSQSQVLLLLRIATSATESAWIDRAAAMNVRKLDREVRRARDTAPAVDVTTPGHAPAIDTPAIGPRPIEAADDEPHVQVSFPAPDWVRGQWDWAVEVFRRTAGAAAPIWQAAEGFAADYLAGLPRLPPEVVAATDEAAAEPGDGVVPDASAATVGATLNAAGAASPDDSADDDEGLELFEEVQRALEDELGISVWLPSPDDMEVTLPPDLDAPAAPDDTHAPGTTGAPDAEAEVPGDAATLDHRLRGLIDIRQNLAWHQGRLLRTFTNYRLYRVLGFRSLSRYCRENLGMSVRWAHNLIALERRLIELPHLERAYREGALSWVKASEIARIAQPETETAWIHLGRSITVRRLRDEVALALADIENESLPWDARRGLPRGLTPDGRVQLSAPSPQPPDPGVQTSAPAPDSPPDPGVQTSAPAPDSPADPGVQTSARSNRISTRIRFLAPEDVAQLWRQALAGCRAVNGDHLQEWECVAQMLQSFRQTWDLRGSAAWRRRYAVFERDGWRCRVPGCTSRRNLHAHHIVFRSQGGSDEIDNLVTVCATHHHRCLHAGSLRCHRLPGSLLAWEFGPVEGGSPGNPSGADSGSSFDVSPATSPGAAPGSSSGDTPADSHSASDTISADPERTHRPTVRGASSLLRFVEDVVWEAARDSVRSTGRRSVDRPCR